jgi:GNAT superfamily N-acetyltransferase
MLTAVHPDLRGKGIPALLITALQQEMINQGVKFAETTGMLESNEKAIQFWKNYNHIQHKRKRCFIKELKSF